MKPYGQPTVFSLDPQTTLYQGYRAMQNQVSTPFLSFLLALVQQKALRETFVSPLSTYEIVQ